MAAASLLFGLVGVACLGTLMGLDAAHVPHGTGSDAALVFGWLTAGALGLILGLAARGSRTGKLGLALGVLALPLGLVAFGIFALVYTLS